MAFTCESIINLKGERAMSYILKVPGKLMIAGEYAVLEPEQRAVVVAVNRYITAHIKPSNQNKLSLPQLGLEDVTWEIIDGRVEFNVSDARLSFIQNSITVAGNFLQGKSVALHPFELRLKSELDDPMSGKKYGLGSSAAVVVAVVSAVLYLHSDGNEAPSLDEIFKLSALAHVKTQGSGSGADIAAAVYGGWLEYSAFSAEWVLNELKKVEKPASMVDKPWPYMSIRQLEPPPHIQLAVGWTGKAAATAPMIRRVHDFRDRNPEAYKDFLRESSLSVARLIEGFETKDCSEAIDALAQNRRALLKLEEYAGITIETPELKILSAIAETLGSGKSSGAGGGDCGIAFLKDDVEMQELYRAWEAADIVPLDLRVSEAGISVTMKI